MAVCPTLVPSSGDLVPDSGLSAALYVISSFFVLAACSSNDPDNLPELELSAVDFPQSGMWYRLENADGGRYLDTLPNQVLSLADGPGGQGRQFSFVPAGDGGYYIVNRLPERGALDTSEGGAVRWTPEASPKGDDKRWRVVEDGQGYRFANMRAGRGFLTVEGDQLAWNTGERDDGSLWLSVPVGGASDEVPEEPEEAVLSTSQAVLPIEVYGDEGYIERVSFDVNNASSVERLSLQAHRLAYKDASTNEARGAKGSVRLNGGPWIDLYNGNPDLKCSGHGAAYGCLNGAYNTVQFSVPVGGAVEGENTLEFRFNGSDGRHERLPNFGPATQDGGRQERYLYPFC